MLGRDSITVGGNTGAAGADVAHLAAAVLRVEVSLELQCVKIVLAGGKARDARLHPVLEACAFGTCPGAGGILLFAHGSLLAVNS
ncbi:hypothetical protein D3C71_1859210 [compost metagenome]